MIYIDDGKTVKEYCTDKDIENALKIILETNGTLAFHETHDGYMVKIVESEDKENDDTK